MKDAKGQASQTSEDYVPWRSTRLWKIFCRSYIQRMLVEAVRLAPRTARSGSASEATRTKLYLRLPIGS